MNRYLNPSSSNERTTSRELADGLHCTLNRKYGTLLRGAKKEWERRFAGSDPSDACVSVRISGSNDSRWLATDSGRSLAA